MKAVGTVADFSEHAAERAAQIAAARQRHPSSARSRLTLAQLARAIPTVEDPAATLTQVARTWRRLHRELTSGPGALTDDAAAEALQVMVSGLVNAAARPGLCLTWPQVEHAVTRFDQVQDGDLEPLDIGCTSYAQAIDKASDDLAWQLYPLIHGLPSTDACPDCIRTCSTVNHWQTRVACTNHRRAL